MQNTEYQRKWREANKEHLVAYRKDYYRANKARIAANRKAWEEDNPDAVRLAAKRHEAKHRERLNKRRAERRRERRQSDPAYVMFHRLEVRLGRAVRAAAAGKVSSTKELVGCSLAELREHIERQFAPGMTWENRGAWHVDHIEPCASFDLSDPAQQRECFNFRNLQPLWADQNREKADNPHTP